MKLDWQLIDPELADSVRRQLRQLVRKAELQGLIPDPTNRQAAKLIAHLQGVTATQAFLRKLWNSPQTDIQMAVNKMLGGNKK